MRGLVATIFTGVKKIERTAGNMERVADSQSVLKLFLLLKQFDEQLLVDVIKQVPP
jgi:hypothetical protein